MVSSLAIGGWIAYQGLKALWEWVDERVDKLSTGKWQAYKTSFKERWRERRDKKERLRWEKELQQMPHQWIRKSWWMSLVVGGMAAYLLWKDVSPWWGLLIAWAAQIAIKEVMTCYFENNPSENDIRRDERNKVLAETRIRDGST